MHNLESKLALGSANFGLDYGLANDFGKISNVELTNILQTAETVGIKMIDTAEAYGDSEVRIGNSINSQFDIVTKIGVGLEKNYTKNLIARLIKKSCERLKKPCVYAVMLHRPEVLLNSYGADIISELQALKTEKIVSKIGVSIYSPDILLKISEIADLDIVQVPFNLFDQRILSSGWANRLKDAGVEIHTRSVFLQGLLLTQQTDLPTYFTSNWPELFSSWFEFLKSSGNEASATALGFALKQPWIDKVVVGVDNAEQLKSLAQIEKSKVSNSFPCLSCYDENLIDPSKWKLN